MQNAVYDRQGARAANAEVFNVRQIDPQGQNTDIVY